MATFRRIGRLRHRITLQAQSTSYDDLGRQSRSGAHWTNLTQVWAEVRELSGREAEKARQIVADATHAVTIRHRAGITSQLRILFRGRVLEIKSVLDTDSSRRDLLLICGEDRS